MSRAKAYAKLNLALVVGPLRADGKHEVATVLQAIDLHDDIELEPSDELAVEGFAEDTLVRVTLESLAASAGVEPRWRARIDKRIPVAAGVGGGSSDAAAALRLANELLPEPLPAEVLHEIAAGIGVDVPFFLHDGPRLGTGDGTELAPLELPTDYAILLLLADDEQKESTAAVYERFDERAGADGFRVAPRGPARRSRPDRALAGPRAAPAERPRVVAPRRQASRCGGLPRRRDRRRPDRLRPLRARRPGLGRAASARDAGRHMARPPPLACVTRMAR